MRAQGRFAVGVVLVVALALAQAAYASLEDRGEELFLEGVWSAGEGDYETALERFERAMAYTPRLNVLWNIACCHVALGNRDLAVACLDRYMEHDLAFQQSAEMQAVVADIAAEPPDMPDVRRREQLSNRVAAAGQAVEKDDYTPATAAQRRYGVGNRGVQFKTAEDRSTPEFQRGNELNNRATELYRTRGPEEALLFAERALAYIATTVTYHNIAVIHLVMGHRDMALGFLDLFQQRLPRLRESSEFQDLVSDIADAPRTIDAATARRLADRLDPAYEWAMSPAARPPVRAEMEDEP
jgi:tetratricopeptide (TPR) repeat protein